MNFPEEFSITLAYNPILLFLGIVLVIAYSIYIYRTTLPAVALGNKIILVCLRSAALLLILFLIFDPLLKITSKIETKPKNLVFIDNSRSVIEFSDSNDIIKRNEILAGINRKFGADSKFYLLGKSVKEFNSSLYDTLTFNERSTDFSSIIKTIKDADDISSVVIISDGIINQGSSPEFEAEYLGIPFYTVGIGDTTLYTDISIESIRSNSVIYTNRESVVEILVTSSHLANENVAVQLFDNQELMLTKKISISESGINRIKFPYSTSENGIHEIKAVVKLGNAEKNLLNNTKSVLINVLDSKKKISLIAGSPSRDLSALIKSLEKNEEFEVSKIIEVAKDRYYNNEAELDKIDQSDVIFLIGFPTKFSSDELIERVISSIESGKKGVFYAFSATTDLTRLQRINELLPFEVNDAISELTDIQVTAGNAFSRLLGSSRNIAFAWEELPPVNLPIERIVPQGQTDILLTDSEMNEPVLYSSFNSGVRNIVLCAINSWRWNLMAPNKELRLYDNFILNSAKWLGLRSEDYFKVALNKEEFKLGEEIIFTANVYDNTFEPLNNQQINLKIFNDSFNREYSFSSIGNGLYESKVQLNKPGIYYYSAKINEGTIDIESIEGTLKIDPVEIEMIESKLNEKLLNNLAQSTGGKYFNVNETDDLIDILNTKYQQKIYFSKIDKELRLSNFELILFIIVLLLSLEWIVRKYLRMI